MVNKSFSDSVIPEAPQALLRLIDGVAFHNAAKKVSHKEWGLSLEQLEERLRPSRTARQLRIAFWSAVTRTLLDGGKIKLSGICEKADCSQARVYQLFKDHPLIVVWLLLPMHDLHQSVSPILDDLADRISELVRLPIMDENGNPLFKNMETFIRVMGLLMPFLKQ